MCKIKILLPNLVACISQNDKNVWFFNYDFLTCSVRWRAHLFTHLLDVYPDEHHFLDNFIIIFHLASSGPFY